MKLAQNVFVLWTPIWHIPEDLTLLWSFVSIPTICVAHWNIVYILYLYSVVLDHVDHVYGKQIYETYNMMKLGNDITESHELCIFRLTYSHHKMLKSWRMTINSIKFTIAIKFTFMMYRCYYYGFISLATSCSPFLCDGHKLHQVHCYRPCNLDFWSLPACARQYLSNQHKTMELWHPI